MLTLDELKAEHPEWCLKCGASVWEDGHGAAEGHICPVYTGLTAALTAAKLEDEATIREKDAKIEELGDKLSCLRKRDTILDDICVCIDERNELRASLSAEQAAHAATKEELRKADEALIELFNAWIADDPMISDASTWAFNEAKDRQAQRAHSDAAKEE